MTTKNRSRSDRIMEHHSEQFGQVNVHQVVSKLLEECGEVAANVTRWTECRAVPVGGEAGWDELAVAEIGDVLIVLTALCGYLGADMDDVMDVAAEAFLRREWGLPRPLSGVLGTDQTRDCRPLDNQPKRG